MAGGFFRYRLHPLTVREINKYLDESPKTSFVCNRFTTAGTAAAPGWTRSEDSGGHIDFGNGEQIEKLGRADAENAQSGKVGQVLKVNLQ